MLRYEVLVNDRPYTLKTGGDPVHVAVARLGVGRDAQHTVEFWAEGDLDPDWRDLGDGWAERTFQVFGTGHPLPEGAVWRGTTGRTSEDLVWHLYELPGGTA